MNKLHGLIILATLFLCNLIAFGADMEMDVITNTSSLRANFLEDYEELFCTKGITDLLDDTQTSSSATIN